MGLALIQTWVSGCFDLRLHRLNSQFRLRVI
jgi:hypothetical protein